MFAHSPSDNALLGCVDDDDVGNLSSGRPRFDRYHDLTTRSWLAFIPSSRGIGKELVEPDILERKDSRMGAGLLVDPNRTSDRACRIQRGDFWVHRVSPPGWRQRNPSFGIVSENNEDCHGYLVRQLPPTLKRCNDPGGNTVSYSVALLNCDSNRLSLPFLFCDLIGRPRRPNFLHLQACNPNDYVNVS